jgi:hypothetical protein
MTRVRTFFTLVVGLVMSSLHGLAACSDATEAPSSPSGVEADAAAPPDVGPADGSADSAEIPPDPDMACAEAATLFDCLICCDETHPPGTLPYRVELDRCACASCPDCEGSSQCQEDGGPKSASCVECANETREHFGPKSCHPAAAAVCDQIPGCVAANNCIQTSKCFSKPAQ